MMGNFFEYLAKVLWIWIYVIFWSDRKKVEMVYYKKINFLVIGDIVI